MQVSFGSGVFDQYHTLLLAPNRIATDRQPLWGRRQQALDVDADMSDRGQSDNELRFNLLTHTLRSKCCQLSYVAELAVQTHLILA